MTLPKSFPINPFPDVKPNDFHKLNKKNVSEDFVGENFKQINWQVFSPFNDTGIDRIISKYICPGGHTKYNENLNGQPCPICNKTPIKIYRFLQIKTRELKGDRANIFGYTLAPEDFRTDPRHIFLFYSDHTNDFIMLSVFDYLNFYEVYKLSDHSKPTFRQGNGKLNDLKYDSNHDRWTFKGKDWQDYVNIHGVELIQNPSYDLRLDYYINHISALKRKIFYKFSGGHTFNSNIERPVNQYIAQTNLNSPNYFTNLKATNLHKLGLLQTDIKQSINNYYNQFQGLKVP